MKFWQKTFICTLALFLVCFGTGIFSLAVFFNRQLVDNCESTCLAEQFYIARSFSADCAYTASTGGSIKELMMTYCEYYSGDGILLALEYDDVRSDDGGGSRLTDLAFDSFPSESAEGERSYFQQRVEGDRYIFVRSSFEGGSITYIKDISYLDEDWRTITLIFVSVGAAVSAVLAALLFVILRRLSAPLARLKAGAEAVASGDYSVRTQVKGSDEFADLSEAFNLMTGQISDQVAALELAADQKQQLVDDLSHEMRTPLTSIHGYAEYMLSAVTTEEERIDALFCIMNESERLSKLSQSLLDISYVSSAEIVKSRVELDRVFESVMQRFELRAKGEEAELSFESGGLAVCGDATLIDLLVSNFVDNAIKACREAEVKRVSVRAEAEGDGVTLSVSDTGKGMSEEELKHIAEPFYRTDRVRSRADGGAGLGVTLCKRIAAAHGSEMKFVSAPGEGTTVSVKFDRI